MKKCHTLAAVAPLVLGLFVLALAPPARAQFTNTMPFLAGTALAFDGVDDVATATGTLSLNNASFSIEVWARSFSSGVNRFFLAQGTNTINGGLTLGFRANDRFTFAFGNNDLDTPTANADAGWHHWACTFNAATRDRRIYRDGLLVTNDVAPAVFQGTGTFTLGQAPMYGSKFFGNLDEVRVWNRVLGASEVATNLSRALAGNEAGLVAYWRCDERAGATVADATGLGHTLSLGPSGPANGPNWIASTAFPAWIPSGDWRDLKLRWPLQMDSSVSAIYSNGAPYYANFRPVGLNTLAQYFAGQHVDYRGNAIGGHNGMDISPDSYRQQNNDGAKVYAAAGGILYSWRDGHNDHPGGAELDGATAAAMQIAAAGWWRFNEAGGTNILDSSGNNRHGFIVGTNWSRINDPQRGPVLALTGTTHVTITNAVAEFSQPFTVAAWLQTTQLDATLLAKDDGDRLWEFPEKRLYLAGPDSTSGAPYGALAMEGWAAGYATARKRLNEGQWHHIAFVFDPVSWQRVVYVDGEPDVMTRTDFGAVADNSGHTVRLGGDPSGTRDFQGRLDDVAVYRGALSQAQVRQAMAGNLVPAGPARSAFTQWNKYPELNVNGVPDGSGNCVYLQHPNGFITQYAHLKRGLAVTNRFRTGDWVPAGTFLGVVGSAGASSNPHLHFGVYAGPENQARRPEIFHPTARTNTGLTRFSRDGGYPLGVFGEPLYEEPGTGETMWAAGERFAPYRPDQNEFRDFTDLAISTAPIWSLNPADNVARVPFCADVYVLPYVVYGVGSTRVDWVNPLGQTNQLTSLSGTTPSLRATLAGEHRIYTYRQRLPTVPWELRSQHSFKVEPPLQSLRFAANQPAPGGTITENAPDTGLGGTVDTTTLRLGDDNANRQQRVILPFDTSTLPDTAEVRYAELRVRLAGIEGINPFERNWGWAGQLLVDVKSGVFGSTATLEPADFQSAGADLVAGAAQFNKARAPGETMIAVFSTAGLAQINRTGLTQLRLRWEVPNNLNGTADSLSLDFDAAELLVYHTGPNGEDNLASATVVTSLADSGPGSLREAIAIAAALPGPNTISFAPELSGGTVRLTGSQLVIDDANGPVTITAASLPRGLTLDGDGGQRAFRIFSGSSVILDSLTITNCAIAGGIEETADGGAVLSHGHLVLNRCTLTGNQARWGGAVDAEFPGSLIAVNSTFTSNSSSADGGAVVATASDVQFHHCTITRNSASQQGGGMAVFGGLNLTHTIAANNNAGVAAPDLYWGPGTPLAEHFNLIGNGSLSGITNGVNGDLVGDAINPADPLLGPLRDNGGPTPTCYPQPGSPALDAGAHAFTGAGQTDQRGQPRVWSGRVDLGAVEFVPAGNALALDGVDDYASLANAGLNLPTNELTIEFWERVATARDQFSFILYPDVTTNRISFSSRRANATTYWDVGDLFRGGRVAYPAPAEALGQWTHWALVSTFSGNSMRVYRNGVLDASSATNRSFLRYAGALVLGARLDAPQEYFQGELDEFRIWSVVRTPGEIQAHLGRGVCPPQPNLWAYWKFDESSGTTAFDSSGNGRHLSLANGAGRNVSFAPLSAPGTLALVRSSSTQAQLTWSPDAGCLQCAPSPTGPWTSATNTTNGQRIITAPAQQFFRMTQ